jgi:cyanuric acid amidohydrolase
MVGVAMKVQRADMHVCSMAGPADTTALEALLDGGTVKAETVVAVVGKTEGTGLHDDSGRALADLSLRAALARRLGIHRDDVPARVSSILSGGCYGVISPHVTIVTREWVEADPGAMPAAPALVIGRAVSADILPEDIGRMGQIRTVAAAVRAAVADAGIDDPADVHCVMVKAPSLSRGSIADAERRGKTVVTQDLSAGVSGAMCYANDGSALGVAVALGEVAEAALSDAAVRRDWHLFSAVATASAGGEKRHAEVLVLGNHARAASTLRIGHDVIRDPIDADGVRRALRAAGLEVAGEPSAAERARIVQVFAKLVVPGSDHVRGRRVTLRDDPLAYATAKAVGGALVASVTGDPRVMVSGGEQNSHQGPPDGSPVAAVVRIP